MTDRLSISMLIHNIYGIGGTNRAVINLAESLHRRGHDIELISIFRRLDEPMMAISADIPVRPLVDMRTDQPDRTNVQQWQRSSVVPPHEEFYNAYSQLTDERIADYLQRSQRDVYLGTRPAINLAIARWAPRRAVRVAQEHQTHMTLPEGVRAAMRHAYPDIDAAVAVTRADAAAFAANTPVPGLRIEAIPNSVPAPPLAASGLDTPIIAAVGRLDPVKRYDLLIRAFARVHRAEPSWQLRIYGGGAEAESLRNLVDSLGLGGSVLLMGRRAHIAEEWVKASIAVSTSARESFGMSIVEAMRCGLPVVSTRAPVGPEEIITDGLDGLLVPVGDVEAIARALIALVTDARERRRMGQAAAASSSRYDPDTVAAQYEALLLRLARRTPADSVDGAPAFRTRLARSVAGVRRSRRRAHPSHPAILRSTSPEIDASCTADGHVVLRTSAVGHVTGSGAGVRLVARGSKKTVDLPSGTDPDDGAATCHVPADAVDEDRWNVYIRSPDGELRRARYARSDTRRSVSAALGTAGPFSRLLPYETRDGFLALRAWRRWSHAECTAVTVEDDHIVVTGSVVWLDGPAGVDSVFAERRSADRRRLSGTVLRADPSGSFSIAFDVNDLSRARLTRHDDWDLFLSSGAHVARLARLGDDIVERKPVFSFPTASVAPALGSGDTEEFPPVLLRLRPYLTVSSDLAISVSETDLSP